MEKEKKTKTISALKRFAKAAQECRDKIQVNAEGITVYGQVYNYADLPLILNSVNKILEDKAEMVCLQKSVFHPKNKMTEIQTEILCLKTGNVIRCSSLPIQTNWPQSEEPLKEYGSAITYVRRYSIYVIMGFLPEQDIDCQKAPLHPPGHQLKRPETQHALKLA